MSLYVTTEPTVEPVSLDEMKAKLRLSSTTDDALLSRLITVAREYGEVVSNRSLAPKSLTLTLDAFPAWGTQGITLPGTPIIAVQSVTYLDTTGASITLDPATYRVARKQVPATVAPMPGFWWPQTLAVDGAVEIDYTAGYGDPTTPTCPATAAEGIRQLVVHLYEHPETITAEPLRECPLAITALLKARKNWTL